MKSILSIALVAISYFASAQSGDAGQTTTILTNATVIDGTGKPAMPNTAIIIKGDKIVSVTRGKIAVPGGAIQIDMTGKYILPSLIDCHSHVGNLKGTTTTGDNYTPENVRHQLLRFQDYGVSAILSMGTEQSIGVALRDSSLAGKIPGAAFYSALFGFGVKGAMPPESMGMTHVYRPQSAQEAAGMVQQLARYHPQVVKIWVDDFYGQYKKDQVMQPAVYTAIIREAHKHGLRVAAHLYYLSDARRLIDAGIDIIAHSIRDSVIDDALVAKMKKKKITYIPTLSLDDFAYAYEGTPDWLNDPFFQNALEPGVYDMITSASYKEKIGKSSVTAQEKEALPKALANLLKIYQAGIPVALGTDAGASPIRAQGFAEHMEMALMVQAGLTPMQVLQISTHNGAVLLHIDKDKGTLEPGKKADLLILEKDPLQDIRNTRTIYAVWKGGVKVSDGPVSH